MFLVFCFSLLDRPGQAVLRRQQDREGRPLAGVALHLDGAAVRSCIFTVKNADGKQVTTIEGLSKDGSHPLQIAWLKNNVPQCGYCQTGQIMTAAELLAKNPEPSTQDINNAMQGNICRCGTYKRIRLAIADAADQMKGV